jgi:hypothetical protein
MGPARWCEGALSTISTMQSGRRSPCRLTCREEDDDGDGETESAHALLGRRMRQGTACIVPTAQRAKPSAAPGSADNSRTVVLALAS